VRVAVPSRVVDDLAKFRRKGLRPKVVLWIPFRIVNYTLVSGARTSRKSICVASCYVDRVSREESLLFLIKNHYLRDRVEERDIEVGERCKVAPDPDFDVWTFLQRLRRLGERSEAELEGLRRRALARARSTFGRMLLGGLRIKNRIEEGDDLGALGTRGLLRGLILDHLGLRYRIDRSESVGTIYVPFLYCLSDRGIVLMEMYEGGRVDPLFTKLLRMDGGFHRATLEFIGASAYPLM